MYEANPMGWLVEQAQDQRLGIGRIDLAAWKDIGAPQHVGLGMALDQQHLQALRRVAQHEHRGRWPRRRVDGLRVEFHSGLSGALEVQSATVWAGRA